MVPALARRLAANEPDPARAISSRGLQPAQRPRSRCRPCTRRPEYGAATIAPRIRKHTTVRLGRRALGSGDRAERSSQGREAARCGRLPPASAVARSTAGRSGGSSIRILPSLAPAESREGIARVVAVTDGSPAALEGIPRGDDVVAVDGKPAATMGMVSLARRHEPGAVRLTSRRGTFERTCRLIRRPLS